jgi:hypothetical protein
VPIVEIHPAVLYGMIPLSKPASAILLQSKDKT